VIESANTTTPVYFGRAADQVFLAQGQNIVAITVWKAPTSGEAQTLMGAYVCEAETLESGEVRSFAARGILRKGPIIAHEGAHGDPVPLVFVFDPPVTLPHKGQFAFAIRDERDCFGIFALEAASGDPYRGGDMWTTGPLPSCEYGAFPGYPLATVDLCFDIEYCDAVSAKSTSWGAIRGVYRN
jgi:hypothetical protein